MARFLEIRTLLCMTQQEMAEVLGCVQSNVSFLDRGQTITPEVAEKLIAAARAMGVHLTFDQVYSRTPLPAPVRRSEPVDPQPADWPAIFETMGARGWSLIQIAVRIGVRLATVRALSLGEMVDAPHAVGCALLALHESGEKPPAKSSQAQVA